MRRFALFTVCSVFLSGCFDFNQTLVIHEDLTFTYTRDTVISAQMLFMIKGMGGAFKKDRAQTEKQSDSNDEFAREICENSLEEDFYDGTTEEPFMERRAFFKGRDIVCRQTLSGHIADFQNMDDEKKKALASSGRNPRNLLLGQKGIRLEIGESDDESRNQFDGELFTVEALPGGRIKISSVFDFNKNPPPDQGSAMFQMMAAGFLADKGFRWSITAPKVLETNGQLSRDGKTVEWELPLLVAFSESNRYEFYAIVQYEGQPLYKRILGWLDLSLNLLKKIARQAGLFFA